MARRPTPGGSLRTQVPFVIIPQWVLEACGKHSQAVHLYLILQKFANREGRAWPPRAQLVEALSASASTLDRAIAKLKDIHALEVRLRHRDDGAVIGADYVVLQVPPATANQIVSRDEMAEFSQNISADEKVAPPFRQKTAAFSSPVTTLIGEPDPTNQIQEPGKTAPAAPPLPLVGPIRGALLDPNKPDELFLIAWNEETAGTVLKPVTTLTPRRRRLIRARYVERSITEWRLVMRRVARSALCRGERGDWAASFDWLIASSDPGVKVLEGQLDDRERRATPRAMGGTSCQHTPRCATVGGCVERTVREGREERARTAS